MSNLTELEQHIEKQKSGLVRRVVTVRPTKPGRSPFQRTQWVRPTEEVAEKAKNKWEEGPAKKIDPSEYAEWNTARIFHVVKNNEYQISAYRDKKSQAIQELKQNLAAFKLCIDLLEPNEILTDANIKAMREKLDINLERNHGDLNHFLEMIEEGKGEQIAMLQELEKRKAKHRATSPLNFHGATDKQRSLTNSKVTSSNFLGGGVNDTRKIQMEDGSYGIFKSALGELRGLHEDIDGTLYNREVAAYEVAKIIGLVDLVPTTTVKEIDGEIGSVQEFVEDAEPLTSYVGDLEEIFALETVQDCALFNVLIGSEDRHGMNAMMKDGVPVLIDHGYTFPNQASPDNPRSIFVKYLQDQTKDRPRPDQIDLLNDLLKNKAKHSKQLSSFLSKKEIAGIFVRAQDILALDRLGIDLSWTN